LIAASLILVAISNRMFSKITQVFFSLLLFLCLSPIAYCADFSAAYDIVYKGQESSDALVEVILTITNNQSHKYIRSYSLAYPSSFDLDEVVVKDEEGVLPHTVSNTKNDQKVITFNFERPKTGTGKTNIAFISYTHKRAFPKVGKIHEINIPVIEDPLTSDYTLTLTSAQLDLSSLSIAKPAATTVSVSEVVWKSPQSSYIYAVFGQSQNYKLDLTYYMRNDRLTPNQVELAFPPETQYQTIFVDSISPQPKSTHIDSDGNFIGVYDVGPKKTQKVEFRGFAQIHVSPQPQMKKYVSSSFKKNKSILKKPHYYWNIESSRFPTNLDTTPRGIYDFVVRNLEYDFDRARIVSNKRLGAQDALKNNKSAICMEFTDTFIALARSSEIYAREIQGYAFSSDPKVQPLSLYNDVLHSWPEYFETKNSLWKPIDPTWANTSKNDYFDVFDLNHIAFAIHGADPILPYPAGLYKIENTKDIVVEPVSTISKPDEKLEVSASLPNSIYVGGKKKLDITVINRGNVFIKNARIYLRGGQNSIKEQMVDIDLLAPYEERTLSLQLNPQFMQDATTESVHIVYKDKTLFTSSLEIIPKSARLINYISALIGGLVILIIIVVIFKKFAL